MSIKSLLKKSRLTYRLARLAQRACDVPLAGCMCLCHALFGVDPNKVYLCSFEGALCNDNPRAVADALHARLPEAKLVFGMSAKGMKGDVPDYVTPVPAHSLRGLKEMATARVLVKNAAMKPWMRKFSDQIYVQTWHGDRGFKRVLLDVHPDSRVHRRDGAWLDLAVSGSRFGSDVFRSSFGYRGEILEAGCPRNDLLVNPPEGLALRVKEELGIPKDAKVLMYAPTFRNTYTGGRQPAALALEKARSRLEMATGERWICVTRGHELTGGIRSDAGLDVSAYPDVSRLLLAVDLLITDYSSIAGDFMLLNRPALFYMPDSGDYGKERGLYFDPEQSPLIIAHTEEELLDLLAKPIDAGANCRAVLDFFGAHETGHASERTAEWIARRMAAGKALP